MKDTARSTGLVWGVFPFGGFQRVHMGTAINKYSRAQLCLNRAGLRSLHELGLTRNLFM